MPVSLVKLSSEGWAAGLVVGIDVVGPVGEDRVPWWVSGSSTSDSHLASSGVGPAAVGAKRGSGQRRQAQRHRPPRKPRRDSRGCGQTPDQGRIGHHLLTLRLRSIAHRSCSFVPRVVDGVTTKVCSGRQAMPNRLAPLRRAAYVTVLRIGAEVPAGGVADRVLVSDPGVDAEFDHAVEAVPVRPRPTRSRAAPGAFPAARRF